jgi:hypothetical protein
MAALWAVVTAIGLLDLSLVRRGGVVVVPKYLPADLVVALRADASRLRDEGLFGASGLRDNTLARTAPQVYGAEDRLVLAISPRLGGDRTTRARFDTQLDSLRVQIEAALDRPGLTVAEQYYSIHGPGAFLGRHSDERHDETKGERGWTARTRRSVSWLVYLSADGWGEAGGAGAGGALRAFCRAARGCAVGAHRGDLQVGWLAHEGDAEAFEPVFLDAWVRSPESQPRLAMYTVSDGRRDMLTAAFSYDSPSWQQALPQGDCDDADERGFTAEALEAALRAQLPETLRARFRTTDSVDGPGDSVEILPEGGTLVLFDSVSVPHDVLPTERGERFAIAGWLHERSQAFPEWFGSD